MEIKQLEFFLAVCSSGSLGKAAARLYTTQPNVSRVITALEDELGHPLFERTTKGMRLTPFGKTIYEHAENIRQNVRLIADAAAGKKQGRLSVSTYPSTMLSQLLVHLHKRYPELIIEHRQGTVEEISSQVAQGVSEVGILYVSQRQRKTFCRVIEQRNCQFYELTRKRACIYVGPTNPLYDRESVTIEELTRLRFVRGLNDFFSMEHHLEQINVGAISSDILSPAIYTNSEHFLMNLLMDTDLVDLGIDIHYPGPRKYKVKNLWIEGENAYLSLGYVVEKGHALSLPARELIEKLREICEETSI